MKTQTLKTLGNLDFFTKETLRQLEPNEEALSFNLKSWQKTGKIISLKNGLYLLTQRWEKEPDKEGYSEFLANKIYEPSYLSGEYVMAKYGLLTEAIYGLSSVTIQKTKTFANKIGIFNYSSITPILFTGFKLQKFFSGSVAIADKPKAIFDCLYFRFLKETPVNEKEILELRINWENVTKKEWFEIERYIKIAKSLRLKEVSKIIKGIIYSKKSFAYA